MRIAPNSTDQTVYFTVVDGSKNLASASTLNGAISSISLNYKTARGTATTTTALTALASATTAHTDNRAYAVGPGVLRVDFPDAPWATGAAHIPAWLTFSGDLTGYEVKEGTKDIYLAYGLQNPDTGSTALAKANALSTVNSTVNTIKTTTDNIYNAVLPIQSSVNGMMIMITHRIRCTISKVGNDLVFETTTGEWNSWETVQVGFQLYGDIDGANMQYQTVGELEVISEGNAIITFENMASYYDEKLLYYVAGHGDDWPGGSDALWWFVHDPALLDMENKVTDAIATTKVLTADKPYDITTQIGTVQTTFEST